MPDVISYTRLDSQLDKSVNFFRNHPDGGMVETRFVQRRDDRFIAYISSMSGCDKACRFCHLTQTSQTMNSFLSAEEMIEQARLILSSVDHQGASTVHFNFMARGECLSNPAVNASLFKALAALAKGYGLKTRIKLSTILPLDVLTADGSNLHDADCPPVDLYYSLYRLDPQWRRRWMPKALSPRDAMAWLKRFQEASGNRVILHWALIEGENDDPEQGRQAFELARSIGLSVDFNLVRYNPANEKSKETSEEKIAAFIRMAEIEVGTGNRARMVSRVGIDVMASCGMFLAG